MHSPLRLALVTLHVVGAAAWFGAWIVIVAFARNAIADPSRDALDRLHTVMRRLGPTVIGPATLLVLVAGCVLVAISSRTAWTDAWVVIGLALWIAVTAVGVVVMGRTSRQTRDALAAGHLKTAAARTGTWSIGALIIAGLLLLALIDMVIRP